MSEVKRLEIMMEDGPRGGAVGYMVEQLGGRYVHSRDYDALAANNAALREALAWYANVLGVSKSTDYRVLHQDGGERARAALAGAKP